MFDRKKHATGLNPFVIDASRLRQNERLEFKYDRDRNLVAIQKVTISVFKKRMEARAVTDISPSQLGKVIYQGTYWQARCDSDATIEVGQTVLVVGRHDLTLLVIPAAT